MGEQLTVRENTDSQYFVKVEDHDRDLDASTVRVMAYPDHLSTGETEIGSGAGAVEGQSFTIQIDPSALDPGTYDIEIVADGKVVHPDGTNSSLTLSVLDTKFDG